MLAFVLAIPYQNYNCPGLLNKLKDLGRRHMDHASHIHIALPDEVTLIYRDIFGVKDYD
jgi:hypothetical protein